MGKPDRLDRLAQYLILIPAMLALANGGLVAWTALLPFHHKTECLWDFDIQRSGGDDGARTSA
jgi:hypothetical protein